MVSCYAVYLIYSISFICLCSAINYKAQTINIDVSATISTISRQYVTPLSLPIFQASHINLGNVHRQKKKKEQDDVNIFKQFYTEVYLFFFLILVKCFWLIFWLRRKFFRWTMICLMSTLTSTDEWNWSVNTVDSSRARKISCFYTCINWTHFHYIVCT